MSSFASHGLPAYACQEGNVLPSMPCEVCFVACFQVCVLQRRLPMLWSHERAKLPRGLLVCRGVSLTACRASWHLPEMHASASAITLPSHRCPIPLTDCTAGLLQILCMCTSPVLQVKLKHVFALAVPPFLGMLERSLLTALQAEVNAHTASFLDGKNACADTAGDE